MIDLKDVDVDKWPDEDDAAEKAAWQEVMDAFKAKGEVVPEHVSELMQAVFGAGFAGGLEHQGQRLMEILNSLSNQLKEARGK